MNSKRNEVQNKQKLEIKKWLTAINIFNSITFGGSLIKGA